MQNLRAYSPEIVNYKLKWSGCIAKNLSPLLLTNLLDSVNFVYYVRIIVIPSKERL